ncbi:MAG: tRNA uridine-5-carboxymethylaminomethyl(34) synthesis GTPase MnmE, partial [Mycoplasma sp.]
MKTIAAIATPLMTSAIHIIRVSGPDTFNIMSKVISKPLKIQGNTIQFNEIIKDGIVIDEVLLNIFVSPKSFTGENCIEINCHGSVLVTKKILDLLIINGCEMAGPGEFSMQAMLNKKMDYAQIEAMNNFINSNNEFSNRLAFDAMRGKWSEKIKDIRSKIFDITGSIEVNIDYPEYDDVPEYSHEEIIQIISSLKIELIDILSNSNKILPLFNGVKIAIIGEPNVGKSSLLNLLSKEEKAIVSEQAGTTRDMIESNISFDGIAVKLIDTAGIRITDDLIEKKGVEKALNLINQADLIIWLKDPYEVEENKSILELVNSKEFIVAYNKSDLKKIDDAVSISIKENDIQELI